MTHATHTPGPWKAYRRGYKSCVTASEAHRNAFAIEVLGADHDANACLIAAAPDLLAACEEMAAQLGGGNDFAKWEAAKAKLVSAIAKAKGA